MGKQQSGVPPVTHNKMHSSRQVKTNVMNVMSSTANEDTESMKEGAKEAAAFKANKNDSTMPRGK